MESPMLGGRDAEKNTKDQKPTTTTQCWLIRRVSLYLVSPGGQDRSDAEAGPSGAEVGWLNVHTLLARAECHSTMTQSR